MIASLAEIDRLSATAPTAPAIHGRIMIVDDEPINIKLVQKHLRLAGYSEFVTTSESREALDLLRRERPDVMLLDVMMPHVTGLQLLEAIRNDPDFQHLPVLILTASTDDHVKLEALQLGATDFLQKPIMPPELFPRLRNALVVKAHHDHLAQYNSRLKREVQLRTAELEESREEVIHVLACAGEYRDQETGNHVLRVGRYSAIVARELSLPESYVEMLQQAAILHDVGKMGIPDAILLKPGKLDKAEFEQMKRHCEYGLNILQGAPQHGDKVAQVLGTPRRAINSPILKMAAVIAISHHERWDGTGYPRGLAGDRIPLEGRIVAVADVLDALASRRPYKEPLPQDKCFAILADGRGKHFDPMVLDALVARRQEITRVMEELRDE